MITNLKYLKSNLYKKSNQLSLVQMNEGLTLNEMQLLAFTIYKTQHYESTTFRKSDFQKYFNLEKFNTYMAYKTSKKIMKTMVELKDIENDYFEFFHLFKKMKYEKLKALYGYSWKNFSKKDILHMLDCKNKILCKYKNFRF